MGDSKKGGAKDEWLDRESSNMKVRMLDGDDIEPAQWCLGRELTDSRPMSTAGC